MLCLLVLALGVVRRTVSSSGVDARVSCDGVVCGADPCLDGAPKRRIGEECCACPKVQPENVQNECTTLNGEPGWAPCREVCGAVEPSKPCFKNHVMVSPQGQCGCEPPTQKARREAETVVGRESESIDETTIEANDPLKQIVEAKVDEDEAAFDQPEPSVASGEVAVEVTWIRHGLSCANVNAKYTEGLTHIKAKAMEYWFPSAMDPPLSDCGVSRSTQQAAHFDEASYDWVGSSVLIRAMQTAALHFPSKTIHAIPHISESGSHNGANKQSPNQEERLGEIAMPNGGTLADRVDYTLLDAASAAKRAKRSEARQQTTVGQFKDWMRGDQPKKPFSTFEPSVEDGVGFLAEHVLPTLRQQKPAGVLRLAVVSHSILMGSELPCRAVLAQPHRSKRDQKKPRNNEALAVSYTLKDGKLEPTDCRMAYEALENPETLCARDVASCPNPIVAPLAEECVCGA